MQLRPRAILRVLAHREPAFRAAMRWYYHIGRQVWPYEIWNFLFRDQIREDGPSVAEFWGEATETEVSIPQHPLAKIVKVN